MPLLRLRAGGRATSLTLLAPALALALALAAPACGSRTGLLGVEPFITLDAGGDAPAVAEAGAADEGAADAAPPLLDWGVGFDSVCMLEPGGGAGCFRFRPGAGRNYAASLEPVEGVSGATHMAGHEGFCAILSDATVTCWRRTAPGPVVKLSDAVEVAVSDVQACARTSSSGVFCWGRVGIPSDLSPDYASPIPIPESEGATALAVTEGLTVATLPDTFLYFGAPMSGEGPVARHPVTEPREPGERIFGSQYDTFCTKVAGARVHCKGGVGLDGPSQGGPVEYDVPGTEGALDVNVSTFSACARLSANDLVCWGTYTAGVSRIQVALP